MKKNKKMLFAAILGFVSSSAVQALEPGQPAPNCSLKTWSGDAPLDLSQYKGKVVYLDFWASWCGPCNQSMPFLSELQEQLKGQGFEVVAVNVDENRQDADDFLANHPAKLTHAIDSNGQCPSSYEVMAMPSSYLIDRQGQVRHIQLGFRPSDSTEIRNRTIALLAE